MLWSLRHDSGRMTRCQRSTPHPFPIFSTAPPGRRIAPRPSPSSRSGWSSVASTPPTSGGTTSRPASAKGSPPPTGQASSRARTSSYKQSSPTRAARTTGCPTIRPPTFPVLHGPASARGWTDDDAEAWAAMVNERDAGRTRFLGVSNVSLPHLEQMATAGAEAPDFVQNRCFARLGWDREVRSFCTDRKIVYQGFSLLTANPEALRHRLVASIAARGPVTPAQVVFRFAQAIGMLPLTGTADAQHMKQDLASRELALSVDEVRALESLVG